MNIYILFIYTFIYLYLYYNYSVLNYLIFLNYKYYCIENIQIIILVKIMEINSMDLSLTN